jgi:hypothetical protein
LYHSGKANVIVDALSRKSRGDTLNSLSTLNQLAQQIGMIQLDITPTEEQAALATFAPRCTKI